MPALKGLCDEFFVTKKELLNGKNTSHSELQELENFLAFRYK